MPKYNSIRTLFYGGQYSMAKPDPELRSRGGGGGGGGGVEGGFDLLPLLAFLLFYPK